MQCLETCIYYLHAIHALTKPVNKLVKSPFFTGFKNMNLALMLDKEDIFLLKLDRYLLEMDKLLQGMDIFY